jgi:hypothetical protein
MKWTTMVAGSLLVCFAYCEPVLSASPPLDRPSPPPCCADGVCRPNPTTFGWYATQWRRWPCEELQPTPASGSSTVPGTGLGPDVKPFETPRVEDEDRRAPPPSKQAQEKKAAEERERGGQPATPPAGSGGAVISPDTGLPPLPTGPTGPATPDVPAGGGPATMPWDAPAAPAGESGLPSQPWDKKAEPTSDSDPPPAPPVATATVNTRRAKPTISRPKQSPQREPAGPMQISSSSDPPPSLPLALSGGAY